ncbi:oligosaccharide flippase family protein [Komarekiella sp. 'clone 1']|uniref:Oligosaccharide flippase family protein n=1 Tax=Komarekiella delphini-convector SJRDD-AB1 TaxID=2593771 RepID=A0AA40VR54_9NOST|nr:oligosaccharide flippase family protein [Komarekiella delphini-convector]MBD6616770.1 oligosaccharide flippase family protein [Komarekiella delphini-convector SJRDD-AB1]
MTLKSVQNSQPLSLRRNFYWTFAGNMIYAGCQWGMLVVLAKLGTPEMVGRFTLGLAVTAPIILFSNLNLRAVQATDAKQQYRFGDYLLLRLITIVLAVVVIVGLTFVGGYRGETALVILVIGLAKGIESISDVFYGLLQQRERMDRIAKSMIFKGLLSLIALGGAVFITKSVAWGTVGLAFVWLFILIVYDIPISVKLIGVNSLQACLTLVREFFKMPIGRSPRQIDTKTLKELLWLTLPLGFVMMLISLQTNIPRYFIERFLGERELGIFAAIAYLQLVGITVVLALGQSATPRLAKYYASGDRSLFKNLLLKLIGVGVILGAVGVLLALVVGQEILTILYKPEYARYSSLFVGVMIAAGIGYIGSYLNFGITATRAFERFTIPYLLLTLLTVATSWLLIPNFGLVGAVWTLCIISIAGCLTSTFILIKIR